MKTYKIKWMAEYRSGRVGDVVEGFSTYPTAAAAKLQLAKFREIFSSNRYYPEPPLHPGFMDNGDEELAEEIVSGKS